MGGKEQLRLLVSKTKSGYIRSISIIDTKTGEKLSLSKDKLPQSPSDMEAFNETLRSQYGDNILISKH